MIPAGYRDGVNWAKTAPKDRVDNLEDFDGTLGGPHPDGSPYTPLEQVYYVIFPEHEGHWDKAAQFWSQFDSVPAPERTGDRRQYADHFAAGAKGETDTLDWEVDSLAEDYLSAFSCGDSIYPLGEQWTRGELLALYRVIHASIIITIEPSGMELGHDIDGNPISA